MYIVFVLPAKNNSHSSQKNCNPDKILLTKYSVQRTLDVCACSVRDTPMVTSMILTVFPFPGGGINESEQLVSSDSFRVDIMKHWLSLLVLVSLVQGLNNLCFACTRWTENKHRMPYSK